MKAINVKKIIFEQKEISLLKESIRIKFDELNSLDKAFAEVLIHEMNENIIININYASLKQMAQMLEKLNCKVAKNLIEVLLS